MREFINTTDFRINEDTIIAIGKFDGEHRGHRKLFGILKAEAKKYGLKTVIFTFHTSPSSILKHTSVTQIFTNEERKRRLSAEDIDYYIEYPFNEEIAKLSGEDFLRDILVGRLGMKEIVAGEDAAFGFRKSGNSTLLRELAGKYGYRYCIIEKEKDAHDVDISSSLIRRRLNEGKIEEANYLLGATYSVAGIVEVGNRIGTKLGFPTLNLFPSIGKLLPRYGVYATKVKITGDDMLYWGLTSVGKNPTIENDPLGNISRVETYLYDFERDVYGREIEVFFYHFIRDEVKFASLEELKDAIRKDKQEVLAYLQGLEKEKRDEKR